MNRSIPLRLPCALLLAASLMAPATAQEITQFQNGQVADANAVNKNFNDLKTAVAAADAKGTAADAKATTAVDTATAALSTASGAATSAGNALAAAGTAQATADGAQATATMAQTALNTLSNALTFASNIFDRLDVGTLAATGSIDRYVTVRTRAGSVARGGFKMRVSDENLGFTIENDDRIASLGLNFLRFTGSSTGSSDLFIRRSDGNVGIGTTSPTSAKLSVNGEIRFGFGQALRSVASSEEALRIVRGRVDSAGAWSGSGFTASRQSAGVYIITFTSQFSGEPTVTASVLSDGPDGAFQDNTINVTLASTNQVTIYTYDIDPMPTGSNPAETDPQDTAFTFIAIGPR